MTSSIGLPHELKVQVTQEDIEKGVRNSGNACPIALALRREYGIVPYVSKDNIRFSNNLNVVYPLNKRAGNFIDNFDGFSEVKPFKFTAKKTRV